VASVGVVLLALVAAYALLDLIVGGQCALSCVTSTLAQAVRLATPIALAAYCGLVSERAGVMNIGIEGMMLMAAMVGYAANVYGFDALKGQGMDPAAAGHTARLLAVLAGVAAAGLLGLLHAVVSLSFRVDQLISGTVVNILAAGVTGYCYRQFLAEKAPPGPGTFAPFDIPLLASIPFVGPIFFQGQKPIVYLMLLLAVILHIVLFRTRWGLRTRAVGEHPKAADTVGIDVIRTRYVNVVLGALIAGLGGVWFTLEAVDTFNPLMTSGAGFIGLAAMIFGKWLPFGALLGALVFGVGGAIQVALSIFRPDIPSQLPQMLPYLLTIVILSGAIGRAVPPAADGVPYRKE
jgi:simple sugar transport system permease protein